MPLNPAETVRSQPAATSSAIRALPAILVAMALFMLFALSSHYEHDAPSAQSHKQWDIGVGPAHWLSISRHGTGLQEATVWGPLQFELHASWLAPVLVILLIVLGAIRHRVMTRHDLTLGASLDRQLKRPEIKWPRLARAGIATAAPTAQRHRDRDSCRPGIQPFHAGTGPLHD